METTLTPIVKLSYVAAMKGWNLDIRPGKMQSAIVLSFDTATAPSKMMPIIGMGDREAHEPQETSFMRAAEAILDDLKYDCRWHTMDEELAEYMHSKQKQPDQSNTLMDKISNLSLEDKKN